MLHPYDDPSVPYRSEQDQTPINSQPGATGTPVDEENAPDFQHKLPTPPPTNRRSSGGLRTGAIIALTLLLVIIFGTGLFAGWEYGRGTSTPNVNKSSTGVLQPGTNPTVTVPPLTGNNVDAVREAVIARVRPAVVEVKVTTPNGGALGSGVIIDRRGYIVTNNHVVNGAQSISVVLYDGTQVPAQLAGTDPADDLAVLKITPPAAGLTVATLGDSSKLQVGEDVLAIGNPLGITETVTHGIISALGRSVPKSNVTIPNTIQTDAPINPGNSGGALADLQGNVIGIPTLAAIDPEFNAPANGVGFAIPINQVKLVVPQIIQNGTVTHTGRAALGISSQDVSDLQGMDNLPV